MPEGPQDVAQHRFSNLRTGLNGTADVSTRIPHTGGGVFCQMGKEVVEPGGLTPIIQAACAALVLVAPVVGSGCMEMRFPASCSPRVLSALITTHAKMPAPGSPNERKISTANCPMREVPLVPSPGRTALSLPAFTAASASGLTIRALWFFASALLTSAGVDFGYRDGPHDANGWARSGRLIADLKLVGVSNLYQFD